VKIDLTELLREVGNEAEVDSVIVLAQPVKLNLHLINTGDSILVKGTIETQAEVECSRCLKKVDLPLKVMIDEEFSRNLTGIPQNKKGDRELRNADFVYPIEKDNSIDISEIIRQNLMLAIPIKNLCRPDCEGLKGE
jgi:uncharacterized protein